MSGFVSRIILSAFSAPSVTSFAPCNTFQTMTRRVLLSTEASSVGVVIAHPSPERLKKIKTIANCRFDFDLNIRVYNCQVSRVFMVLLYRIEFVSSISM